VLIHEGILFAVAIVFVFVLGYFAGAKLITKMYKEEMASLQKKSYILPIYTILAFFFVDKKTKLQYIETPGKMVFVGMILAKLPANANRYERREQLRTNLQKML
jgi:mannose/fructose/N-acetylgalactosamine-specific phosphotransferase system component IID